MLPLLAIIGLGYLALGDSKPASKPGAENGNETGGRNRARNRERIYRGIPPQMVAIPPASEQQRGRIVLKGEGEPTEIEMTEPAAADVPPAAPSTPEKPDPEATPESVSQKEAES